VKSELVSRLACSLFRRAVLQVRFEGAHGSLKLRDWKLL
jgi:hypothetical protein